MNNMIELESPAEVDRSTYLGSSDAAAILGVSKWATPLDVYRQKVEGGPKKDDADKAKLFRRGRLMEPVIRQMAVEDFGLELYATNRRHWDQEHPWMRAEIDFETLDPDGLPVNNDCKSVSPFAADQWGEEGTDEIPIEYHAQFQYGLMITGRARCDVYALFGSDHLVRYVVHRDEDTIAGMRAKCIAFWTDHVLAKRPPSPITVDDVEFLMRRLGGRRVVASPDLRELINEYRAAKAFAKEWETKADDLKFDVVNALRLACEEQAGAPEADATVLDPLTDKPMLTWKEQSTARIDVGALREEAPEIALKYTKTTTGRVLRLSKSK